MCRALVSDVCLTIESSNPDIARIDEVLRSLEKHNDTATFAALVDVAKQAGPKGKLFASCGVLAYATEDPLVGDAQAIKDATECVVSALTSGDDDLCGWACLMLTSCPAPEPAVPLLERMLDHADPDIRVLAAAALGGTSVQVSKRLRTLRDGLRCVHFIAKRSAAIGLVRLGAHRDQVLECFSEMLRDGSDVNVFSALIALRTWGTPAAPLLPRLMEIIGDPDTDAVIRAAAASTIGRVSAGTDAGIPSLLLALGQHDTRIVCGALYGLQSVRVSSDEVLRQAARLLASSDPNVRSAAADLIARAKERSTLVIHELVSRLWDEPQWAILDSISEAISNIGEAVLPPLLHAVHAGDYGRVIRAGMVFVRMGEPGATALAADLAATRDIRTATMLVAILREMGSSARPAVAALASALRDTRSEELACMTAMAINSTGAECGSVIPELVDCLLRRGDEAAGWAQLALWNAGPRARKPLQQALQGASPLQRQRIHRTLAGLRDRKQRRHAVLAKLGMDVHLKRFVMIGQLMEAHGPLSYPQMQRHLETRVADGTLDKGESVSASTLRVAVDEISAKLGRRLTSVSAGQKGRLTPSGLKLLKRAQRYLDTRQAQRRD